MCTRKENFKSGWELAHFPGSRSHWALLDKFLSQLKVMLYNVVVSTRKLFITTLHGWVPYKTGSSTCRQHYKHHTERHGFTFNSTEGALEVSPSPQRNHRPLSGANLWLQSQTSSTLAVSPPTTSCVEGIVLVYSPHSSCPWQNHQHGLGQRTETATKLPIVHWKKSQVWT